MSKKRGISRRQFIRGSIGIAGGLAFPLIVPRRVLGGPGETPPSKTFNRAVIGTGGRGMSFVGINQAKRPTAALAVCDVDRKHLEKALATAGPECRGYTDYRRVLDRKDIDVVYIATPPHWHALIAIHAMQAGKDVYCEKPMTKFIYEGRAVADAARRYGRIFQIGTFGRYHEDNQKLRKLVMSELLGSPLIVRMPRPKYDWKVKMWSGRTDLELQTPPEDLDWDMWLGPAPWKPFHRHRCHGSFRGYWDYDGGGIADMGAHYFDPVQYIIGADDTGPVEIEAKAPWPAHPDAIGLWGSITYKFADGTIVRCVSGEWGDENEPEGAPFIEGPNGKLYNEGRTDPPGLFEELSKFPDPPPLVDFETALRTREQPGGNAEVAHRVATILHLGNLAIRLGRKLRWDPVRERFIGDEEANRFVNIPMRAPWRL